MTAMETQNSIQAQPADLEASYDDPAVTRAGSAGGCCQGSIGVMFARPSTPSYPELSAILQKKIQDVLLGQATPEDALQDAAKSASKLR